MPVNELFMYRMRDSFISPSETCGKNMNLTPLSTKESLLLGGLLVFRQSASQTNLPAVSC